MNAVIPARGGDVVKLFIAKRRVEGEHVHDARRDDPRAGGLRFRGGGRVLIWATSLGVLPSLDVLPNLPDFDFGWFFRHPQASAAIAGVLVLLIIVAVVWAMRTIASFRRRVAQGFAIFRDRPRYLRTVASWQAFDWLLRVVTLYWFLLAFGSRRTSPMHYSCRSPPASRPSSRSVPAGSAPSRRSRFTSSPVRRRAAPLLAFSVGMNVTITIVNGVLGLAAILLILRTLHFRRLAEDDAAQARLAEETPT